MSIPSKKKNENGLAYIQAERLKQIKQGKDALHDQTYLDDELIRAALAYLCACVNDVDYRIKAETEWPWKLEDFNLHYDEIKDLAIAGALIAAEIDRRLSLNK